MQFESLEQWIWLPKELYPDRQTTARSFMEKQHLADEGNYTVVRCQREYLLNKPIKEASLRMSADTFFRLSVNGVHTASGPASVGGDFLSNERVRPQHYATVVSLKEHPGFSEGKLDFSAVVRMMPSAMFEYSQTHGGFFLTAHVRFEDGTKTILVTDESWMLTLLPAYCACGVYDGQQTAHHPVNAERITNLWHCLTSPIPPMTETPMIPENHLLIVPAGETVDTVLPLDMIYTGYPSVKIRTTGKVTVQLQCIETDEEGTSEQYIFTEDTDYLGFHLHSAGKLHVVITNEGDACASLDICLAASHFPVSTQAITTTSDPELDQVLRVCAHTLKYCRQTLHLDSGRHCEPLACTGDYYIEALMTMFTYGDQRLSAFDVRRTAQLLRYNNGRMFHTTYSLIWVQMLWDVYRLTGEEELLTDCEDALTMLMERFTTYLGENGLIETPPDYMFIDWLYPDAISTHHPPKALGQTCLNLFYYGALVTAEKLYTALGESAMAAVMEASAQKVRNAICTYLFDPERKLFFEGLNTPTPEHLLYSYMPQNVEKRYYRMHANVLAAYFDILGKQESKDLLHRILADDSLGEIQPYFAHFLLEAVYRCGLRDIYTLKILEDWKEPVRECPYGLAEGFHKPQPTYHFDHSHAWGGTPAYSLPLALSGLELLTPGWKKIRLEPSLLGLEYAQVRIPTPYGMIELDLKKDEKPEIHVPEEITVEIH